MNYCERMRAYYTEETIITEPCGAPATIKERGRWYCEACWERCFGETASPLQKLKNQINSDRILP
jgi:hypothetical protein